jgi:hypothetical protein
MTKLDIAWKNCLKEWDGVIKILDWLENLGIKVADGEPITIHSIKRLWLELNGYGDICCDCFFCQYADERGGQFNYPEDIKSPCSKCPGTLVDSDFDCEPHNSDDPCWIDNPREFYQKLLKLNEQRLT